jgi:phospholipase C
MLLEQRVLARAMQQGDAPYLKSLADHYAKSDNFHQSVNGGTGVNNIMFGHCDAIWFNDATGHAAAPPKNVEVYTAPYEGAPNSNRGIVSEIENNHIEANVGRSAATDAYLACCSA